MINLISDNFEISLRLFSPIYIFFFFVYHIGLKLSTGVSSYYVNWSSVLIFLEK